MKYAFLFVAFFGILSCKSPESSRNNNAIPMKTTDCPEDGKCRFEVLKDQNLTLENDEFENQYLNITDGTNILLKFEYQRNNMTDVADSGYIEQLFLQLNPKNLEQDLVDKELNKVKLIFARLCFCRGQTGYYEITDGELSITKNNATEYVLELSFQTDEVPQIITRISETFLIKP